MNHGIALDMENAVLFWPELIQGTLITRYKRFLADIRLPDGETVTAHCPNSGRMTGCCEPGRPVYISRNDAPSRKLKFTWEIIGMPDSLVGVNTQVPNRLVCQSARSGGIAELSGYERIVTEVRAGEHTRLDLMLTSAIGKKCYVEIKNCTLVEGRTALFPDAVTARGTKHLVDLQKLVADGHRCMMLYLVQRMDAEVFKPADRIDPVYGRELRRAVANGVEIAVYDVHIDLVGIRLRRCLPWCL